jgi:hypothetical protein
VTSTPSPAAITETTIAAWKPSSNACGDPSEPPAALFTAVATARTIAPPTWKDELTSPLAKPCSWGATPFVPAMFSGPYERAKPKPARMNVGSIAGRYRESSPIGTNSAYAAAAERKPTVTSR